jgi:hypothetical protein
VRKRIEDFFGRDIFLVREEECSLQKKTFLNNYLLLKESILERFLYYGEIYSSEEREKMCFNEKLFLERPAEICYRETIF